MKSIIKSRVFAVMISLVLAVGIFLYLNGQDQFITKDASDKTLHLFRTIFNK